MIAFLLLVFMWSCEYNPVAAQQNLAKVRDLSGMLLWALGLLLVAIAVVTATKNSRRKKLRNTYRKFK